jgi:cytochrome c-type biogenesis protein CcmF
MGVVLIAVAYAASHSFAHQQSFALTPGQSASFDGHTFTYQGSRNVATDTHTAWQAVVVLDGGPVLHPAVSDYPFAQQAIGTPSVHTSLTQDVYLKVTAVPASPKQAVGLDVIVEPLVSWIWLGGAVMLIGTALAAWPTRRRTRTAVVAVEAETADEGAGEDRAALVGADARADGDGAEGPERS